MGLDFMTAELSAHVFTGFTLIAIAFQIALAAGMPWGHLTWGGRFPGQLPARMRRVAIFSAVLLTIFTMVVESRAGVLLPQLQPLSKILIWVVVAYSALGVVANAATPSHRERILWLPVVVILLICSLVVATGRPV